MLEDAGGRKFLLSTLLVILSFVLVLLHLLETDRWITFVIVDLGIYSTANVASKLTDLFKE